MIETHFWGQEGAAREYNSSIWKLPDWPFKDFDGRIPKDKRSFYIDAALSGIKWRLDTSHSRIALTHFDTIKVPGGTGFLAATQVFNRAHCPSRDALVQMRKQLEAATAILSSTKVYKRPESIPLSGIYETIAVLPPEESSEAMTWLVSGAESDDLLLEAIRQVCCLRHSNLNVMFSHRPKDSLTEVKHVTAIVHSVETLPQLLEKDRVAYHRELELARQREEEKRAAQELARREAELEQRNIQSRNSSSKSPIPRLFVGAVVLLVIAIIGLRSYLLLPRKADVVVVCQRSEKIDTVVTGNGCDDPKAMNFLDENERCQYQEFIVLLDNIEDGWFRDSLFWHEHHFVGCERIYRFSILQAVSPEDIQELEEVFNKELNSRGSILIRPSSDEVYLEISVRFESFPADEDRISLIVPKHFDFPFAQIQMNILHQDRDADGDGFPASQDQFPFQGGRCDGIDENEDGVDDVIFAKHIKSVQE